MNYLLSILGGAAVTFIIILIIAVVVGIFFGTLEKVAKRIATASRR